MADKLVSMHTAMHGGEVPTLASGVPSLLGIPVARSAADLADPAAATSACCAAKPKANTAAGACC